MSTIKMDVADSFEELFEIFQASNKARNLAPDTIKDYEYFKKQLVDFMGGDFQLSSFGDANIQAFIEHYREKGNKPVSINTKLRHLKAAFNYFAVQGYCSPLKIKMLKAETKVKDVYSDAELEILLRKPNLRKCAFDDYRNFVVCSYALSTGNRLSTICNLKIKDINLQENEIILRHAKNKKQQIIPLGSALKSILIEYLKYRKATSEEDYLFPNWHGGQLTTHGLRNAIVRYHQRRGISKTSIHVYRNTFAKKFLMNGGDALRLQKLLNQSSLDMVKRYVEMYSTDLKVNYDAYNPLTAFVQTKEHIKLK